MHIAVLRFSMNEIENNYKTWQLSFFGVYIPQPDKDLERNLIPLATYRLFQYSGVIQKILHANFDRF